MKTTRIKARDLKVGHRFSQDAGAGKTARVLSVSAARGGYVRVVTDRREHKFGESDEVLVQMTH